jgi:hypothetical protein
MPDRRPALFVAAVVPVLGLVELGLSLAYAARTPKDPDWDAARPAIEALKKEGDLLTVSPYWAEPHARRAFGDGLFPLRDVARPDVSRYPRVLEVSVLGKRDPELSGLTIEKREPLAHGLELFTLTNPSPARVRTDFVDLVDEGRAEVTVVNGQREDVCPFRTSEAVVAPGLFGHPTLPPRRHVCGRQAWQSVGVTVHEDESYRARRCIWTHPVQGGETSIRFHDVELGSVIRGHMSLHWTLERARGGAPIDVEVAVDGDTVGTVRHEDGEGWKLFTVPLGAHAEERTATVTFRVRTTNANERHLCWEADSR